MNLIESRLMFYICLTFHEYGWKIHSRSLCNCDNSQSSSTQAVSMAELSSSLHTIFQQTVSESAKVVHVYAE